MRHSLIAALALLAYPAAAGPLNGAQSTSPPAKDVQVRPLADAGPVPIGTAGRARAEAALGNLPGRWNPARRCWMTALSTGSSTTTACLGIVKGYTVTDGAGAEIYLLLEGKGDDDSHASSGLAAFAMVTARDGAWHPAGRPVIEQSGEYGNPNNPDSFTFARLGAARWGWIEKSDGFGQGLEEGTIRIHLMQGGAATDIGELPGDQDNTGACDTFGGSSLCEQKIAYTVTATADAADGTAAAYPIILHAHGIKGQAIDTQLRVPFDERTGRYTAPGSWP